MSTQYLLAKKILPKCFSWLVSEMFLTKMFQMKQIKNGSMWTQHQSTVINRNKIHVEIHLEKQLIFILFRRIPILPLECIWQQGYK